MFWSADAKPHFCPDALRALQHWCTAQDWDPVSISGFYKLRRVDSEMTECEELWFVCQVI